MLRPRWSKMLRDAWQHRARSLLVSTAIALGLVATGALLDTWALVQRVTATTFGTSHPVSATLQVEAGQAIDAALLEEIRRLPGIAAVRARRAVSASLRSGDGNPKPALLFALDDFDRADIGRLTPEHGTWPPADGTVVIEQSALEFAGIAPGGTVTLQVGQAPPQALPVSGSVRDVSQAPGWMDHVVYAFVTPASLRRLGAPEDFDQLQFVASGKAATDRAALRRLADTVKAQLETHGRQVMNIDVPLPGEHPHAAQMASLVLTQGAFALLTLLVCACLIVNLISAMLRGQTREIAVMKTLGASNAALVTMYLGFALLLGLLASLLALPPALLIARSYAGLQCAMLNFPLGDTTTPGWAIALQLAAGCLLPVVAAAWPVRRACAMSIASALHDTGLRGDGGTASVRRRLRVPGLGRPLLLALGNAFRQRPRLVLTLLALATGGAVYLAAADLRRSVRDSIDLLLASQRYDLSLDFDAPHPIAALEAVAGKAGLQAQAWSGDEVRVQHADGFHGDRFRLLGVPPDSPLLRPTLRAGRWLDAHDERALVISRNLQHDEPQLLPGSTVTLLLDGRAVDFSVVGLIDGGPQKIAVMPRATRLALLGDGMRQLAVVAPQHDPAALRDQVQQLRERFARAGMPVASSQIVSAARAAIEDHLLMVVNFLGAMGWVMIVVGGIGLATTMSVTVLERRREIGVMRALGARHRAVLGLIQGEGLVIALLGWALAIPLSMPLSVLLSDAFGRIMFSTPARLWPDLASLAGWLALVLVVSVLACGWPALRALRVPTAAALSYA